MKVVFMGSPLLFKISSPESLSTNSETSSLTLTRSHNRHLLHSVIYQHVAGFWFVSSFLQLLSLGPPDYSWASVASGRPHH